MHVTPLIRSGGLIIVQARLWGRDGSSDFIDLALDTAASETLLTPRALARFGYGAADSIRTTTIRSAVGAERGYLLHVARFWALGFGIRNEMVHAHELPGQYDIDGLLGLRFLDRLDYTIHSLRNEVEARFAMIDGARLAARDNPPNGVMPRPAYRMAADQRGGRTAPSAPRIPIAFDPSPGGVS